MLGASLPVFLIGSLILHKPISLDWQNLISESPQYFAPDPSRHVDRIMTYERLLQLPKSIRRNYRMANLAIQHNLKDAEILAGGVYGKVGFATKFIAPIQRFSEAKRIYWMIVRILSEKYGCFMRVRWTLPDGLKFLCRDGRYVRFWQEQDRTTLQIYAKQYRADGRQFKTFVTRKQWLLTREKKRRGFLAPR